MALNPWSASPVLCRFCHLPGLLRHLHRACNCRDQFSHPACTELQKTAMCSVCTQTFRVYEPLWTRMVRQAKLGAQIFTLLAGLAIITALIINGVKLAVYQAVGLWDWRVGALTFHWHAGPADLVIVLILAVGFLCGFFSYWGCSIYGVALARRLPRVSLGGAGQSVMDRVQALEVPSRPPYVIVDGSSDEDALPQLPVDVL